MPAEYIFAGRNMVIIFMLLIQYYGLSTLPIIIVNPRKSMWLCFVLWPIPILWKQ